MAEQVRRSQSCLHRNWSEGSAKRAIESAARLGFDIIEVLIAIPRPLTPR